MVLNHTAKILQVLKLHIKVLYRRKTSLKKNKTYGQHLNTIYPSVSHPYRPIYFSKINIEIIFSKVASDVYVCLFYFILFLSRSALT